MTEGAPHAAGRGILHRRTARERFHVDRRAPAADLAWAALSAELGYADQAHFIRDFTGAIVVSPTRYAQSR